jgi:hypothetical protein
MLQTPQDIVAQNTFRSSDILRDAIECSSLQRFVRRDGRSVPVRYIGSELDVASRLMHMLVIPVADQVLRQLDSVYIPWQLQATARISSCKRCSRIDEGASASSK